MSVSGRQQPQRHLWVDALVGLSLTAAILGGVGFIVVYALGGNTQLEGLSAGVAALGLTIAIGLWSKHYLDSGTSVSERPVLDSKEEDRAAIAAEVDTVERGVMSRRVLVTLAGGAFATVAAAAIVPFRSLGENVLAELRHTAWADGRRLVDTRGVPVRVEDLLLNEVVTVFPEGVTEAQRADSQALLLRVGSGVLSEPTDTAGYVTFSKVCTHAGCPVGLYQADTHQLVCPCHQSLFDVTRAAMPVFGPATRPLPQLPMKVQDGFLVATGDFPEPIGPGFWSLDTGDEPQPGQPGQPD